MAGEGILGPEAINAGGLTDQLGRRQRRTSGDGQQ